MRIRFLVHSHRHMQTRDVPLNSCRTWKVCGRIASAGRSQEWPVVSHPLNLSALKLRAAADKRRFLTRYWTGGIPHSRGIHKPMLRSLLKSRAARTRNEWMAPVVPWLDARKVLPALSLRTIACEVEY